MQITSTSITWDSEDFMNGFVPVQGTTMRTLGKGLASMSNFNPFLTPGVAGPGYAPTAITNVTASLPSAVQVDITVDNGGIYAYSLGGTSTNAQVNQTDITSDTISNAGAWPHTITPHGHATADATLGSVVFYNVSGSARLFYSWGDATDWDVGNFDLSATFDDDYMSTAALTPLAAPYLAGGQGKAHPLYVARADDILYIGSSNFVHQYKGSTNTFSPAVLTIPVGYEITGFAETPYDLVIFATTAHNTGRRGKSTAFFWDNGRPTNYYKQIPILDDDVNGVFSFGTQIGCFSKSKNAGQCVLRVLEGDELKPKFYWTGTLPTVGGVDILNNQIVWNSDGQMYRWGSYNYAFPEGTTQTEKGTGSTSGFVRSLKDGNIFASSGTGTSGGFEKFTSATYASSANIRSLTAFPPFKMSERAKIKGCEIAFANTGGTTASNRSVAVSLVADDLVAYPLLATTSNVSADSGMNIYWIEYNGMSDKSRPQFSAARLNIDWGSGTGGGAAPLIKWVTVYYETVNFVSTIPS